MGPKEIEVFKVKTYPVLNDIDGLRETAYNIDEAIKRVFLGHAKLALVGCGTSGASLMTAVSMISNIDTCLVTKKSEENTSHRPKYSLSLHDYHHLIVVDDRIETGDTMYRISSIIPSSKVKMVCAVNANEKREQLIQLFPNCKYFCY